MRPRALISCHVCLMVFLIGLSPHHTSCFQDLGPLCAAAAFAEIIKPPQHNMFVGRQRQLLRNGRLETLDGTFMDTEDDWCASTFILV